MHWSMQKWKLISCWLYCESGTGPTNRVLVLQVFFLKTWKMRYYLMRYNALLDTTYDWLIHNGPSVPTIMYYQDSTCSSVGIWIFNLCTKKNITVLMVGNNIMCGQYGCTVKNKGNTPMWAWTPNPRSWERFMDRVGCMCAAVNAYSLKSLQYA